MTRQKYDIDNWAALYVRLSRDDELEGDSNSISHQIEILTKYCKDHNIFNYRIYKDDGYSGTNFNRPGFKEMLADIERKLISTVIVKDMSRFGRNYLEVGMYTEVKFPDLGVRFIAINDGVDSDRDDNDFTPFRNIINEWYAKDTSKKIRAVVRNKGMSGKRVGTNDIYGYIRNSDGSLTVDEETAPVIKLIFNLCLEGNGPGKIARILKERQIPTPGTIAYLRYGRTSTYNPEEPYKWGSSTVGKILAQDAYLGQITNFKTYKPSYKSKKMVHNTPDKMVTFENTHEAIIDRETWELVQKIREQRNRPTKYDNIALFSGIAYCADCNTRMYHSRAKSMTHEQECYTCGTNKLQKGCSAHYIRSVVLEQLVLQNLQKLFAYIQHDEESFARMVMENKMSVQVQAQEKAKSSLQKALRRTEELDNIIKRLYEDNLSGKISDERFNKLSADYENEQATLTEQIPQLQQSAMAFDMQKDNLQSFIKVVRKYTQPTELTSAMVRELIDKIVVHEPDRSSGHRVQQVDIYYNFIGEFYISQEFAQNNNSRTSIHSAVTDNI